MPDPPLPASRRHRLRLNVRGLLILVLVVGGWLGWVARSARTQREAVAAIQLQGGWVYYDWQRAGDLVYDPLANLKGLAKLEDLHLFRANVTDAGLKVVRQTLPRLRVIR